MKIASVFLFTFFVSFAPTIHPEMNMRFLSSVVVLMAICSPAFAIPVNAVPEPGTIGLVGAGIGLALWLGRRGKK